MAEKRRERQERFTWQAGDVEWVKKPPKMTASEKKAKKKTASKKK